MPSACAYHPMVGTSARHLPIIDVSEVIRGAVLAIRDPRRANWLISMRQRRFELIAVSS